MKNIVKIWQAISNLGVKYETDIFSQQNVQLLNQYTFILILVFIVHTAQTFLYFHDYISGKILIGFVLFLIASMTVFLKLRMKRWVLCLSLILFVFLLFFYESYTGGIGSGIYLYYYTLLVMLPFIFDYRKDLVYMIVITLAIIIAFLVNTLTKYSLFTNNYYIINPAKQRDCFYLSTTNCFIILAIEVIFLARKGKNMYDMYNEKQKAEAEIQNMHQIANQRNEEMMQAKQELLVSNLRITEKNQLLEKIKDMNSRQIDNLVRQEKTRDKELDDVSQMYLNISPEFFRRISEKAAPHKLTNLNLKYCAYIYSRKSNKEIADILNISIASVKSNKRYLKHKLNLSSTESLDNFIHQMVLSNDV